MGLRVDVHVVLGSDRVVVRVPRFGVEFSDEPLVAVVAPAGKNREVAAVGEEARGTIVDDAAPVACCNPVVERDLEVLEAMLAYFVVKVWWDLPWWVKLFGERRVRVETAGLARDEATCDAIAQACSASPDGVTIDGTVWHGRSPHEFRLRGWRDGLAIAAVLAGGVFVASRGLGALGGAVERTPELLAIAVLLAAKGVHAVWWHTRQQRRRAAQRERLMAQRG